MEPPLTDDDALLAALGQALATARHSESDRILADGREAFAFATVADEFAALVYDSMLDEESVSTSRARGEARTVVFESATATIEIEITDDAIVGQVAPTGPAEIVAEYADGHRTQVPLDDLGCFTLTPGRGGRLRFHITVEDTTTVTDWL